MDRSRPSRTTAFNKLPIELNKEIAHHLTDHKDIAAYSAVCIKTRDAVNGDNYSFWRAKYCEDFAMPKGKSNKQLCDRFKFRWKWLNKFMKKRPGFVHGHSRGEKTIVSVLTELIVESFADGIRLDDDGHPHCPNMVLLRLFALESKLLVGGKRPPPAKPNQSTDDSLLAARLMLSHFLFDQATPLASWFAIDDAQKAVYAATNRAPLYLGPDKDLVNLEWTLQCMNFFRYYMTTPEASQLFDAMGGVEVPSPWREPLKSGSRPFGQCWKGTYSFLDHNELVRFRKYASSGKEDDGMIFADLNVDEGKIQSLNLEFLTDGTELKWPTSFEQRLQSRRNKNVPQMPPHAAHSSLDIRFDGWGEDLDDDFKATGWLNALPDQCGIPGWQRITFMKHFADDLDQVQSDNLWAYEGVVLPGGRIILGRWCVIDFDNDYGGPFILWAVEPEPELVSEGEE
ncbi:hypothetical protein BU23DRAFT_466658 [Bimuria novae-zelandiae CBS 107.79]|uniref:F-box domain-containing protein n=1 Tax=Bimuria novae-zelandiae CBS 107.79 TaxID=1447943 RepID=A0A6A5VHZ8_9PLEO|nr:hypothetical protein BU23DRAFT_466658 [Bimuria novae-zelandiae CBS 107.79]